MKKAAAIFLTVIMLLNLCGCERMENINDGIQTIKSYVNDIYEDIKSRISMSSLSTLEKIEMEEESITPIAEEIISYIENEDYDSLKAMFSSNISEEMDFDTGYQYTIDLYEGKCQEVVRHGVGIIDHYGSVYSKEASGWYIVRTDKKEYKLYLVYIFKSTDESDNGLKMLKLYEADDQSKPGTALYAVYYRKYYGIYNPSWDDAYYANPERWEF
jgi:hypothetical protein